MSTPPKKQPVPFGKYLLLDRVNIGGMAEVWRGKMFGAEGFERLVAIKRILPNIAEDEEFITMFIDEAKISVQLTHANIAQIYELGQIQSSYFIAMEYIPGKDMRAIFERCRKKAEPAPIPLTCYVVSKLCEGLDYAHRKKDGMGRDMNIVHRDVSPQNVLISYEGEVKVIDFGIAKAAGKATKTQAGILKGKFGYMSPEQIRGLPLDRRSDVFAIGVCLYEMLTGERLFVGESDFSVLEKVRKAEVLPPSTYNRRIPETLERIVLKSLARDVDERYQYASELADDLQRFLITSDSIFSRKDLMQYMKSTFAEEVEREKVRIQEYSEVKAPAGFGDNAGMSAPRSIPAPPPTAPVRLPSAAPQVASVGNAPTRESAAPRPRASLTNLPKLTAAQAAPTNQDDNGATIISMDGAPSSAPIPKLSAAHAAPTHQDDNGATVLAADRAKARAAASHDDGERDTESGGKLDRSMLDGPPARGPSVDPRLARGHTNARVPQSHGRQETDPGVLPPEQPTNPNGMAAGRAPPTLRPSSPSGPPTLRAGGAQEPKPRPTRTYAAPEAPPVNPAGGRDEEDEDLAAIRRPSRGRGPLLAVFAALAVIVVAGTAFLFGPKLLGSKGMLLVEVPSEVQGKARLFINGEDQGVQAVWPAMPKVPVGPAVVVVVVDGYEPFTRTVDVKETKGGTEIAKVRAEFKPRGESAPATASPGPK